MRTIDHIADQAARALALHESTLGQRPLVVACSGGADSTALAHAVGRLRRTRRLNGEPMLVYCDHSGADPERSAHAAAAGAHVAELAWHYSMPFRRIELELPADASESRMREARYDALVATARAENAGAVLTAHHADDDLETVLFRLMRGTGPRGLAGIPRARWLAPGLLVVRPFLGIRRADLRRVLEDQGLPWIEDDTNHDPDANSRAAIRQVLLPKLRATHGRRLDADLFVIARVAKAAASILEGEANRLLVERATTRAEGAVVELDLGGGPRGTPLPVEPNRDVLREALRLLSDRILGTTPTSRWLERALLLTGQPTGHRLDGGGGLVVERTRAGLLVWAPERLPALPEEPVDLFLDERPQRFGPSGWRFRTRVHGSVPLDPPPARDRALLDAGNLHFPLKIRPARPDDRFRPLGMQRDTDLRRFLIKRRVPRLVRERQAVVVDGTDDRRILWVPGIEIADDARIRVAVDPARDPGRRHPTRACLELRAVTFG